MFPATASIQAALKVQVQQTSKGNSWAKVRVFCE
jgi:hypothetical protein